MTRIRIQGLTRHYQGQPVLRGVDLDAPDGSVLALLGPSGCGKTTLLRLIAGFEYADGGEIVLGDMCVEGGGRALPPEKRRVGYVPQEGALFPHLTVAGNVGYGLPRRERGGARIAEVLSLVGLADLAHRFPHELSGGQQQRVALARALAPRPALILLDEPFNALDLDLRRSMCEDVVALLRRAGATVVLVTHDPGEAFATADRVAVMQRGRIMQHGAPADVYQAPASAAVARLTGATVFLDGVVDGATADTPLGRLPLRHGAMHIAGPASVMLRPEQIVLAGAADAAEGVRAAVVERRFRGNHTALTVAGERFRLEVRASGYAGEDVVRLRVRGACMAYGVDGEDGADSADG